jgi:hypothetical protein
VHLVGVQLKEVQAVRTRENEFNAHRIVQLYEQVQELLLLLRLSGGFLTAL